MSGSVPGMAQSLIGPGWPPLSIGALAAVLAEFDDLGRVIEVVWRSRRPFAASGIVRCSRRLVFIKRHDPRVRSARDLTEEHAFIAHLQTRGAPTSEILLTRRGESALSGPDGTYEVHALGKGEDVFRDVDSWMPAPSVTEAAATGLALARLHNAADGFSAPKRRTGLVVAGDSIIRSQDLIVAVGSLARRDGLLGSALRSFDWQRDFAHVLVPWHQALAPFWPALPPAWVHGDFHISNLLWHEGCVSSILDFGLSNQASTLFDLATAIERNAIEWLRLRPDNQDIGRADLAHALMNAYAEIRRLSHMERAAIRHLLPVVHVDFALSEMAYFHGITASTHDTDLAYSAFLLGHAAWFTSTDGAEFLSALAGTSP